MKKSNILYFLLIMGVQIILEIISKEFLNLQHLYTISLSDTFTLKQIDKILDFQSKWQWVGYVLAPVLLFLKLSIIAAILDIGVFFYNKEIKYGKLFNIVVKAEYIFLLVIVVKTLWLYFVVKDYTFEEVQNFYPFSLLHLFGADGLDSWYLYPLQSLNLFEIAYWLVLAYFLGKALSVKIESAFKIVLSSYGVAFFIWVVAIMFLVLNMK